MEISPQSSKGEGTLTHNKPCLVFYKSDSEGKDNLMVNGTIIPMTTQVEILLPFLGVREVLTTLLDSGCTQCLISLQTVEKLGLRLRKLR